MGEAYKYKINPINDVFVETLLDFDEDISKREPKEEIRVMLMKFLMQYTNPKELELFDFDIKNTDKGIRVIAKNFATAMIFCNIIPSNFSVINNQETLQFNGFIYSFDKRKKRLIKIKNNG